MAERLYTFLEIWAIVACLHGIYGENVSINKPTIILVLGETVFLALLDICNVDAIWSIAIYPFIAIYILVEFPYDRKGFITGNMLYILVVGVLQLMAAVLIHVLHLENLPNNIVLCIANSIVLVFIGGFRKKLYWLHNLLMQRNILIAIIAGFYFYVLICGIINYKEKLQIALKQALILLLFRTMYGIVIYCWQKEKENTYRQEMELKVHKLYSESFKVLLEDIRKRQHEFQNHLQAILCMHFTIHTYEELVYEQEKYVGVMAENNRYYKLLTNDWPILAGFLYGKFQEAEQEGIKIRYKFQADRKRCSMPEFIFIEIIGILLDNAREAIKEKKEPVIWVEIVEKEKLQIMVANPVEILENPDLEKMVHSGYTTKSGHMGLGLTKIVEYQKRYGFRMEKCIVDFEQRKWLAVELWM